MHADAALAAGVTDRRERDGKLRQESYLGVEGRGRLAWISKHL